MKLLLDENVSRKIKEGLIKLGLEDVKHINEVHKGIPDKDVFKLAKDEQRVLITGDDDFKSKDFKYKIPVIWITPVARSNKDIHKLIKWILDNIDKYNINIERAFISIRKSEYFIEYKNKDGVFGKLRQREIDFKKVNKKTNKP